MASGYIKLARKIKDNEHYKDSNTIRLFIHLLLTVNYEEGNWRGVVIHPGSRVCSRVALANELDLTVRQVRTSIDKLVSSGTIKKSVIPMTSRGAPETRPENAPESAPESAPENESRSISIISIENWDLYQGKKPKTAPENAPETRPETRPALKKLRNKEGGGDCASASRLPLANVPDDWDGEF